MLKDVKTNMLKRNEKMGNAVREIQATKRNPIEITGAVGTATSDTTFCNERTVTSLQALNMHMVMLRTQKN